MKVSAARAFPKISPGGSEGSDLESGGIFPVDGSNAKP